jgi:predicted alpha/beta superfamily hydrolase
MEKRTFECDGRIATLFRSEQADSPLIVLNNYSGDGTSVFKVMHETGTPECHLLVIGDLRWNHDMTPWYCPAISEKDTPCTGGADEYLNLLLTKILPKCRTLLAAEPRFLGIAGYSLAGLFALYAMFQCEAFDRVASMSGSVWFPEFKDYVMSHELQKRPDKLYISLGDREARTNNPFLKAVQENTEQIVSHFVQLGLNVAWELNPGNHFKDAALRSAKGIKAILE